MKDGVLIINCARGGIVNENDVADAIKAGKIGGLGIDVYDPEPPDFSSPIFEMEENVVFTPHLGASTKEAQTKVGIAMAEQVIEFAKNNVVLNAVNMPSMNLEVLSKIQPFVELSEKLGKFMGQICKTGVKKINVKYSGAITEGDVKPLTMSVLKGYLTPIMDAPITFVNAPLIADDRGIEIIETKESSSSDFSSLISVEITSESGEYFISGSTFGKKEPRFTKFNNHVVDIIPEGNILMIENDDKPGVIGLLGNSLGKKNININRLYLSNQKNGNSDSALAFISVDSPVSQDTLEYIANMDEVNSIEQVILD